MHATDRLSGNVAGYTAYIVDQLDRTGAVRFDCLGQEDARKWQSRILNAARHVGFIVETYTTSRSAGATLVGWRD